MSAMTPDEIDAVAERTAAKIAQGLLRMPDDLRQAMAAASIHASGFYSSPGSLWPGPDSYYLQALTRPDGIELIIKASDGSVSWRTVIV